MKRTAAAMLVLMLAAVASAAVDVRAGAREGAGGKPQWAPTRISSALNARAVFASESRGAASPYAGEGGATAAGSGIWLSRDDVGASPRLMSPNGIYAHGYAAGNPMRFVDADGRWELDPGAGTERELEPDPSLKSKVYAAGGCYVGFVDDVTLTKRRMSDYDDGRPASFVEYYRQCQPFERFSRSEPVRSAVKDVVNNQTAADTAACSLGLVSVAVPWAPNGDTLPQSMQHSYSLCRSASGFATTVVSGVEAVGSLPQPPRPQPALVTNGVPARLGSPPIATTTRPPLVPPYLMATASGADDDESIGRWENEGGSPAKSAPTARGFGRVQSRINLADGATRFTPRRPTTGQPVSAGWRHVLQGHFNRAPSGNISVFTAPPDRVRQLLQSPKVVNAPVRFLEGGQFERVVDVGEIVGTSSLKNGGRPTSVIKVLTDEAGNLITAYPQ